MKNLLLILVLALVAGCAPQVATELVIDPELSPEHMAAVVEAVDDWCAHVPAFCVSVSVGEDRGGGYVTHANDCTRPTIGKTTASPLHAPIVKFCDNAPIDLVRLIAKHEIGHALSGRGDHVSGENVMSETGSSLELSALDIEWATH